MIKIIILMIFVCMCVHGFCFEAGVSNVRLEIPLIKNQRKATTDLQKLIASKLSLNIGRPFPIVVTLNDEAFPVSAYCVFFDDEISEIGKQENFIALYECIKEAAATKIFNSKDGTTFKCTFDTERDGMGWKGCFCKISHIAKNKEFDDCYIFYGSVFMMNRTFLVQAFTYVKDKQSIVSFQNTLYEWLRKLVSSNSRQTSIVTYNHKTLSRVTRGHKLEIPIPNGFQIASGNLRKGHYLGRQLGGLPDDQAFETFIRKDPDTTKGGNLDTLTIGLTMDVSNVEFSKGRFEEFKQSVSKKATRILSAIQSSRPNIIKSIKLHKTYVGDEYVIISFATKEEIDKTATDAYYLTGFPFLNGHIYQFVYRRR